MPKKKMGHPFVKRCLDLALAVPALILLSPLFLATALLIKLDSPGPVFFRQKRVGKGGKVFTLYKFRTLRNDAPPFHLNAKEIEDIQNFVFQGPPEESLTRVGKFLRATSLNELPQLFNVLKGEMSLVGPRPEVPDIVALYPPEYRKRLSVKPGITGLAQVEGRNFLTQKEILELDCQYIASRSFWLDVKLLAKTVQVVLSRQGAG